MERLALRRLWCDRFHHRDHPPPRRSDDVDIAIAADVDDLVALQASLEPKGWERESRKPHRWRHERLGLRLDVVPAGRVPGATSKLDLTATFEIDVRGLDVALSTAEPIAVGCVSGDQTTMAPTPPLPVLVLLKIIAYDDKPRVREKDVFDVARVTLDYLDKTDPRRWDDPHINSVVDVDYHGAAALAQEMKPFLTKDHRPIVVRFFENELVRKTFSTVFARHHGTCVDNPGTGLAVAFLTEMERADDR